MSIHNISKNEIIDQLQIAEYQRDAMRETLGTPEDELLEKLGELNLGSRTACRRTLDTIRADSGDVHKCLECGQYFDTFLDLRKHLKKRKHLRNREHVKRMRMEFIEERLAADGVSTIEQAQRMFDHAEPRAMTASERSTWTLYNIQLAWLVRL